MPITFNTKPSNLLAIRRVDQNTSSTPDSRVKHKLVTRIWPEVKGNGIKRVIRKKKGGGGGGAKARIPEHAGDKESVIGKGYR